MPDINKKDSMHTAPPLAASVWPDFAHHAPTTPPPLSHPPTHPSPCLHEADISVLQQAVVEIKDNLKNLTALLTSYAVLEEQAGNFRESIKRLEYRLGKVEEKLTHLSTRSGWAEKLVWYVVAAACGGIITKIIAQ